MKIIDVGVCINNIDPKGIGRIRYRPYGSFVSEIANGVEYNEWDDNDPFIALPFLPSHINIVPQKEQSIKLIKYDTDKDTQNVEYMPGPYTSPHDLQNQTFSVQNRYTTYGGTMTSQLKDVRDKDGLLKRNVSPGVLLDVKDTGIKGNYGSDMIFTENGLTLRGGYLVDKLKGDKKTLFDYPKMSNNVSRFSLKKFPYSVNLVTEETDVSSTAVSGLKYIVEYGVDSLENPTKIQLFIYKILDNYGNKFNTNVFDGNTVYLTFDSNKYVKLINFDGTSTTPSVQFNLSVNTLVAAYTKIRTLISDIDTGILDLNTLTLDSSTDKNVHPFYFRPTNELKALTNGGNNQLYNNVIVRKKTGDGLIYSKIGVNPPTTTNKVRTTIPKEIVNSGEQTFASLIADKIFITSTNTNGGDNVKTIDFKKLNPYELTQEDYIQNISPNTYSVVRGENLLNLLIAMKNLLYSHIHQINEPLVQTDPNFIKFESLLKSLENDLLNKSIRFN